MCGVIPCSQPHPSASTSMPSSPSYLNPTPSSSSNHQTILPSNSNSSQQLSSEECHAGVLTSTSQSSQGGKHSSGPSLSMPRIITPRIVTLPLNLSSTPPFDFSSSHDTATADNPTASLTSTSPFCNFHSLDQNVADPATTRGTVSITNIPGTSSNSISTLPQSSPSIFQNGAQPLHDKVTSSYVTTIYAHYYNYSLTQHILFARDC